MSGLAAFEDGVVEGMQRARSIIEEEWDEGSDLDDMLAVLDRAISRTELEVRARRGSERRAAAATQQAEDDD
jgi:hypothetical protein